MVYLSVRVVHLRKQGAEFLNNSLYPFLDGALLVLFVLFNTFWFKKKDIL